MKYKQRIIVTSIATLLFLFLVVVYNKKGDSIASIVYRGEPCHPYNPLVTADWTVDAIYNDLNFTLKKDGLYNVIEKSNIYTAQIQQTTEPLEIIVVPHSHNDPGWLWTFEDYYNIRTRQILTNSIKAIQRFPDFRMIWTETVFLDRWWKETPENLRSAFRDLVLSGKIEILSGGWVSVDEATTHYGAVLDQLIEGHLWIKEHFGVFPNTSWSIDPFGYSSTLPYLWKKAGMKDMAILRIHGAVKQYMGNRKLLTYKWRQQWDEEGTHDIMCHVEPFTLYNIECSCGPDTEVCRVLDFSSVGGFQQNDQEIRFGQGRTAKNFEAFVELVVNQYKKKALFYKNNVILMPHGDDFRYIEDYDFELNYVNMKKLIEYVNSRKDWNINMRFGTVGDYFEVLNSKMSKRNSKETSLTGDFFTYTDKDNEYWSGYFSTRPFDKRMIRELFELLRTTETMMSLIYVYLLQSTNMNPTDFENDWMAIKSARRTHGLMQHHDAITGTSAAGTVIDFEIRIFDAINKLSEVLQKRMTSVLTPGTNTNTPDFTLTRELVSPVSPIRMKIIRSTSDTTSLVFINSYTRPRREVISVILDAYDIAVYDSSNKKVPYQINPVVSEQSTISNDIFEISFEVKVPAVGFSFYKIKRKSTEDQTERKQADSVANISSFVGTIITTKNSLFTTQTQSVNQMPLFYVENNFLKLSFLKANGALQQICLKSSSEFCLKVKIEIFRYLGNNSNAYCFNTNGKEDNLLSNVHSVVLLRGRHISQVKVQHKLFVHTVTLYNTDDLQGQIVHIENNVTLIPTVDRDTELMMRFATSIHNQGTKYFTDSNGFQMMARKLRRNLPIGANFYPFTTMAVMEDEQTRLTIHTAQPLGISGLSTGSLEVMLDRVPMSFGKGLDESVTDNKPTISKFVLQIERMSTSHIVYDKNYQLYPSKTSHVINDLLQNPIVSLYTLSSSSINQKEFSFLESESLPCDTVFANFRTLLTEEAKFIGTGITLHKRAPSCSVLEADNICPNQNNISLDKMFRYLEVNEVKKMSLSHLFEMKSEITKNDMNSLNPMDLQSFQFRWKT